MSSLPNQILFDGNSVVLLVCVARAQEKQKVFNARYPIDDFQAAKTKVCGS